MSKSMRLYNGQIVDDGIVECSNGLELIITEQALMDYPELKRYVSARGWIRSMVFEYWICLKSEYKYIPIKLPAILATATADDLIEYERPAIIDDVDNLAQHIARVRAMEKF